MGETVNERAVRNPERIVRGFLNGTILRQLTICCSLGQSSCRGSAGATNRALDTMPSFTPNTVARSQPCVLLSGASVVN
jgi:hypothetical protein